MWHVYVLIAVMTALTVWGVIGQVKADSVKPARAFILLAPFVSLAIYLFIGNPDLDSRPAREDAVQTAQERATTLLAQRPMARLAKNPDDLGALEALAEINLRAGRADEAVLFYSRAEKVARKSGDVRADFYRDRATALKKKE